MRTLAAALSIGLGATAAARAAPSSADVQREVRARLPSIEACYDRATVTKPWLEGWVVASFSVDGAGHVTRVEIDRSDIGDVALLACFQDAMLRWTLTLDATTAARDVSYPFVFGARSGARDPSVLVDGRARPMSPPAKCKSAKECRELGTSFAFGTDAERARAFEYFQTGCGLKDAESCAGAARALDFGRGVDKDRRQAFALAEKACKLGAPRACTTVAMAHALGLVDGKGVVVKPEVEKAVPMLERACAAQEPVACLNLAERLRLGLGVPRDEARAADLRRRTLDRAR